MVNVTKDIEELILEEGIDGEVIALLSKLKALDLAMFNATGCPEVQVALDSPVLQPFWVNKFNKLRLGNDKTGFQFRNPEPQSRADFYCGYVLYLAALQAKKDGKQNEYDQHITLSLSRFNSFYAAQEIMMSLIGACKSGDTEDCQVLYDHITSQNSQIEQFKTPGYLLLANAYFYLAGFYQRQNLMPESIACYKACWENLHLAQLLEESSVREIHNAYFGQGLAASNAFGLSSIAEIKEHCLAIASAALPYPVRNAIEKKAEMAFSTKFNTVADEIESEPGPNITSSGFAT